MSLAIDVEKIKNVLLQDGKWYEVLNQSFLIDLYEYPLITSKNDSYQTMEVWFNFQSGEGWLNGPFISILAVRTTE